MTTHHHQFPPLDGLPTRLIIVVIRMSILSICFNTPPGRMEKGTVPPQFVSGLRIVSTKNPAAEPGCGAPHLLVTSIVIIIIIGRSREVIIASLVTWLD